MAAAQDPSWGFQARISIYVEGERDSALAIAATQAAAKVFTDAGRVVNFGGAMVLPVMTSRTTRGRRSWWTHDESPTIRAGAQFLRKTCIGAAGFPRKTCGGVGLTSQLKERLSEALIINRSDSKCGACGQGADPHAETHAETRGYGPQGDGCGVRWRYVTSEYTGPSVEAVTREMRPDLEWFERWPGIAA